MCGVCLSCYVNFQVVYLELILVADLLTQFLNQIYSFFILELA